MEKYGSELQQIFSMLSSNSGVDQAIAMAEKTLNCHLPPSNWSGFSGVSFLMKVGVNPPRVLKLRYDFMDAVGIDLNTHIEYTADTFTALILDLCDKKQIDFETLIGFTPEAAPREGNYLVGITVLLCAGLELKSKALEGIVSAMRKVIVSDKFASGIVSTTKETNIMNQYFVKTNNHKVKYIEDGKVDANKFPTESQEFMKIYVDLVPVLQTKRKLVATNKVVRKAVRNELGNKKVKSIAKVLKLDGELDRVKQEMEAESELEGFEDYSESMDVESTALHQAKERAVAIYRTINTLSVLELLKKLTKVVEDIEHNEYLCKKIVELEKADKNAYEAKKREAERFLRGNN